MKAPTRRSQSRKKAVRAAPRKKAPKAAPQETVAGLCVNCAHRDGCGFRGASAVHQCEEYRCEGPGCAEAGASKAAKAAPASPMRRVEEPPDLKGLCVNCESRFDCCFPKPPGGVWHCQEYR